MRRIALSLALCTLFAGRTAAQWTLRQCMEHAVSHNIGIRQKDNTLRQQELRLSTARNSRLPDLSGSAGQNLSFGRAQTLDGTYSNRNTRNTSLGIGTTVPLFTGFQIPNQIRLSQLNLEAATADLEKARNDIRMEVARAYVQALYDMEMADVAHRQTAIDSLQVVRLDAFVSSGKASLSELSRQKATLAQSRLTATQADNNRLLALLALTQLLELPSPEGFSIVRPDTGGVQGLSAGIPSADAVYQAALGIKPEVRAEQLRVSAAERSIDIARAAGLPKLNLNAGLQTNYYRTNGLGADAFFTQMKNNFAQYVGVSLSVPIFARFQVRNGVRMAEIDRDNQLLSLEQTKKNLYKEIQQVCHNARAARARHASCQAAVSSSRDAFVLTRAKYENGKAGLTEFNEAKNQYLKAESDMVQARYEYIYQAALIAFYQGRELDF